MIHKVVTLGFLVVLTGCSGNLDSIKAGREGGFAKVNVAEFGRPPERPSNIAPDEPARTRNNGKYQFSIEEVQFREQSFLANGSQAPSIKIVANNEGYAPVSAKLTLEGDVSENANFDAGRSFTAVVPPRSKIVIARVDPRSSNQNWKVGWHYSWKIGDFNARHSCREGYRLPFSEAVSAFVTVPDFEGEAAHRSNVLTFRIPAGASVLSARKGTVVRIGENNDVDVLHEDQTVGTYSHLEKLAPKVQMAEAVNAGDPIGFPGRSADEAFFQLVVWRPEQKRAEGLHEDLETAFEAVSFPVEFCTTTEGCGVLKRSQRISLLEASPAAGKVAAVTGKGDYFFHIREQRSVPRLFTPEGTSTDIVAVNPGYAPVSVVVNLNSDRIYNTKADVSLPHAAVVPPLTEAVVARLSSVNSRSGSSFGWNYLWRLGDYRSDHKTARYRLPFAKEVKAFARVADRQYADPYILHAIGFSLSAGSKVLAARNGTVILIKEDEVDVLHEDTTIATYSYLAKVEKGIFEGKPVTTGDVLGWVGNLKNSGEGYLQMVTWRPELYSGGALLKGGESNFISVSIPMEFCSDGQGCKILTHDQQLPGPTQKKSAKKVKAVPAGSR